MSGYQRGGVQMTGYRAIPTPLPPVGTSSAAPTSSYTDYQANGYVSGSGTAPRAYGAQYSGYNTGQYGNSGYAGQYAPRALPDDYERWYTENAPNNRMLLALKSGIDSEVAWALDRLCRLCINEQFMLAAIPGLIDALFEWPEWFVEEFGCNSKEDEDDQWSVNTSNKRRDVAIFSMFGTPPPLTRKRRHALESLIILRTASLNEPNAEQVAAHSKTRRLIVRALTLLDIESDETEEFVLTIIELLQSIAGSFALPPPRKGISKVGAEALNPVPVLDKLAGESSNRSTIIASLTALSALFNNPQNLPHTAATLTALAAAIRYLPIYQDTPLVDACVNFLYVHLSHPPMTKAFLLHPDMPSTLKLLVGLIISEQVEETAMIDISGPRHMAPAVKVRSVNYELVGEELERISSLSEPERCFEWMRAMFVPDPNGELTQVDFWTAYKDLFTPFQDRSSLLVASDVIKNVSAVFTNAQAMVLPGPPQRFVIRGISRRTRDVPAERYVCQWSRSECTSEPFKSPEELYVHVQGHLEELSGNSSNFACAWATCQYSAVSLAALKPHVWTHISLRSPSNDTASEVPLVTFASATEQYLIANPTQRPPPPPPSTTITFPAPAREPPSCALTALLVIRTLFRASYASTDTAPRADADHFGFPGLVEDSEEQQDGAETDAAESELEGARRGKRAFVGVRHLMESVHIRDTVLMGWVDEMVETGISGSL